MSAPRCRPHDWVSGRVEIGSVLGESPIGPRWCAKCGRTGPPSKAYRDYLARARSLCEAACRSPKVRIVPDDLVPMDRASHNTADGRTRCDTVLTEAFRLLCDCGEVVWVREMEDAPGT